MLKIEIDKEAERKILRNIERFQRDQIPYAVSVAINDLGDKAAQSIGQTASVYLDRPTPFTRLAYVYPSGRFRGKRSTKRNLVATLTPADRQAQYLYYQIKGGTDTRNKAIPAASYPLDQYGNLPRRATRARGVFLFRKKRIAMAAKEEKNRHLIPVAFFNRRRNYRARYPVWTIAELSVLRNYKYCFRMAFEKAHA